MKIGKKIKMGAALALTAVCAAALWQTWGAGKNQGACRAAGAETGIYQAGEPAAVVRAEVYGGTERVTEYDGSVYPMDRGAQVEVEFSVEKSGRYEVSVDYCSRGGLAEKPVLRAALDENDASGTELPVYYDCQAYPFDVDDKGNEIVPQTVVSDSWHTAPISVREAEETSGGSQEAAEGFLNLEQGTHRLTLQLEKGSILLGNITVSAVSEAESYTAYREARGGGSADGSLIQIIEAERLSSKNSPSPRPLGVRDMEAVPYKKNRKTMCLMGGATWSEDGQTLYYQIDVETAGWYNLAFKYKQDMKQNTCVYRTITIDGKLPFAEAGRVPFASTGEYRILTLGNDTEAYPVYLEAGAHTLGLTVDGSMIAEPSRRIQALSEQINQISLQVRKITGNRADSFRDWDLLTYLPDLPSQLVELADEIERLHGELLSVNQNRENSQQLVSLKVSANQLRKLAEKPDDLPNHMDMLSDSSGSVGQMLGDVAEDILRQPLKLDQIYLYQDGASLPAYQPGLWRRFRDGVSFFCDSFGKKKPERTADREIEVWVNRSRDHIDLMDKLTASEFTPKTGIRVVYSQMPNEQKLILANTSGTQPDAALGLSTYLPYDMAVRRAVYNLGSFDDFDEVAARFSPGVMTAYTCENGVYALPETQNFYVLFYRRDLLEALSIPVPDTWEDVTAVLPELQRYGMNFYLPMAAPASFKTFSMTYPFIRQYGGRLYQEDGMSVAVGEEEGLEAMRFMSDLYTIYGLPTQVGSFYQMFRSGSIPMGVADFDTYLKLKTAAGELKGNWDIAPAPGRRAGDGTVERWMTGAAANGVIFSKSQMKDEAWEFLKWWTSSQVQTEYGTQLELLYGTEYMWNTANVEAFAALPFEESHKEVILEQWQWIAEPPKTPASYMVEREISNVWNEIVFDGENARSALDDSVVLMDRELVRKMEEFGYMKNGRKLKDYPLPTAKPAKNQEVGR